MPTRWPFLRTSGGPSSVKSIGWTTSKRRLLEVASVTGGTCSAAAVAAGAGVSASEVEATLAALARRHAFVREGPPVEWPDGTLSATYEFLHSLYREVLSARPSPARRVELHRLIGDATGSGLRRPRDGTGGGAGVAFRARSRFRRALSCTSSMRRRPTEAAAPMTWPSTTIGGRWRCSRSCRPATSVTSVRSRCASALAASLMQTSGWGAPEVEAATRACASCQKHAVRPSRCSPALWNLWIFYIDPRRSR